MPPRPANGLADPAGVLSSQARQRLEAMLVGYAQDVAPLPDAPRSGLVKNTARYAVAVFPSLEQESLEDFSMRIAEAWKVGGKKNSDGVLITIFIAEHKIRIDVGYGLEDKVPDVIAARVIREQMAPRFRAGDIEGGIAAALGIIDQRVTGREHAAPVTPRAQRRGGGMSWLNALLLLVFVVIPVLVNLSRRRRGGGGGGFGPGFLGGYLAGSSGWSSDSSSSSGDGGGSSWGGSSGGSFGGGGASGDW